MLFEEFSNVHGVSSGALGVTYGAASLIAGVGTLATGRRLDALGPTAVLGLVGPVGAVLLIVSSFQYGSLFLVLYACGGGLVGSAGFYAFTQPLAVRLVDLEPARAITRLTIWGALSSPVMIPLTEGLRAEFGWQVAVRAPAALAGVLFVACAISCRPRQCDARVATSFVAAISEAVQSRMIRRFSVAGFLGGLATSTLLVYQLPTLTWAGVASGIAAGYASARGFLQLAGRLPLVAAIHRWGAARLMMIARLLVGLSAFLLIGSGTWWIGVAYVVVAGVSIGALSALDGVVARQVIGPSNFGTVMAVVGLFATIGGSVGPVIGGVLRDRFDSPAATLALVVIAVWLSVAVLASMRLTSRRD